MPLIVVYNPICGDRTAKAFFQDHVLPFLATKGTALKGVNVDLVVETEYAGDAGRAVAKFIESQPDKDAQVSVVLGSGDGTLHEILNEVYFKQGSDQRDRKISIALIPCGTANALYSSIFPPPLAPKDASPAAGDAQAAIEYRLQSLKAFLEGRGGSALSLAVTQLHSSLLKEGSPSQVLSAVVTSTSLHAAILHYSESLRQEHPGLERFKMAAEQNVTKWFKARVRLLPFPYKSTAEIYDPKSKSFVPVTDDSSSGSEEGVVELKGPFAYFLSTINVDRLEPSFVITPLSRTIAPPQDTCDVVVIRPLRDPSVVEDNVVARGEFVPKTWAAMIDAYQEGAHVRLRYGEGGKLVQGEGDGETLVEYYRCGGWEWHPEPDDEDAHLVCSDGAINRLEPNGWAKCRVSTTPVDRPTFEIYAP